MNELSIEEGVWKNSSRLMDIFSEGFYTLVDTNIFLGFPYDHNSNILNIVDGEFNERNIDSISQFNMYIWNLFKYVEKFHNILSPMGVIDELLKVRRFFDKKLRGFSDEGDIIIHKIPNEEKDSIKEIRDYISGIKKVLEKRIYEEPYSVILNNSVLFDNYKERINKSYLKSMPFLNEEICADDGLVAASFILLNELKNPIILISNDRGVWRRLRKFRESVEDKETYLGLINKGVILYNCLNPSGLYEVYMSTTDRHV